MSAGTPNHSQMSPIEYGWAKSRRSMRPCSRSGSSSSWARRAAGSRMASTLRGEGGGYELADAGVIGRLEPQETPALHVPERLPARVERLCAEFLVAADGTVVPAEPSIAEARANVGVACHEPRSRPSCRRTGVASRSSARTGYGSARNSGAVGSNTVSYSRADVLQQAVHTEGDERRDCQAQADDAEDATGRREPLPHLRSARRSSRVRAPCERERDDW